jgi:hypothetical protein
VALYFAGLGIVLCRVKCPKFLVRAPQDESAGNFPIKLSPTNCQFFVLDKCTKLVYNHAALRAFALWQFELTTLAGDRSVARLAARGARTLQRNQNLAQFESTAQKHEGEFRAADSK